MAMNSQEDICTVCLDGEDDEPAMSLSNNSRRITRSSSRGNGSGSGCGRGRGRNTQHARNSKSTEVKGPDNSDIIKVKKKKTIVLEGGLELSIDDISDEEIEQSVRVIWVETAEIHRFNLKPSETLHSVYEFFSKKFDMPKSEIKVRHGDNTVSMYSTLESLKLRVTEALEGYAVKGNTDMCTEKRPGKMEIKCLLQSKKNPVLFYLYPKQDFSSILKECAKEIGCSEKDMIIKFDGERVKSSDSPASLDLDGGECIEVHHVT